MLGAVLLGLPVHAGGAFVKNLHAIAAGVSLARLRIFRDHHRPGDVAPAVLRPALKDGKIEKREALGVNHFLAIAAAHDFWEERANFGKLRKHLHFFEDSLRGLHFQKDRNSSGDFVQRIHFERQIHAALGSHEVRHDGDSRPLRPLEQKRRATGLHRAVGDVRDFKDGVHLG